MSEQTWQDIRALIAKWRAEAVAYRQYKDPSRNYDMRGALNYCADELEQATKALPLPPPSGEAKTGQQYTRLTAPECAE